MEGGSLRDCAEAGPWRGKKERRQDLSRNRVLVWGMALSAGATIGKGGMVARKA